MNREEALEILFDQTVESCEDRERWIWIIGTICIGQSVLILLLVGGC